MREISVKEVEKQVGRLFIEANNELPDDILRAIKASKKTETSDLSCFAFEAMLNNVNASSELNVPLCQDTGMAIVFLKVGQDIHFIDGDLYTAINSGVRNAYVSGLLRKSVVADPLRRENTKDNTPAIIHTEIVSGDKLQILCVPKGFGSENMSGIKMLTPSAEREGVINAVLEIVKNAGSNPCPPIVVGVGIGGDFEQAAILSKKALCRSLDISNSDEYYKNLEAELLERINILNIGPQGFGGKTTALGVNIEVSPTHIAGLPVAVNIGCHVTRHKKVVI